MDTRWPFRLLVNASDTSSKNCSITFHFEESGYYTYETKIQFDAQNATLSCAMVVTKDPVNSNIRKCIQCS